MPESLPKGFKKRKEIRRKITSGDIRPHALGITCQRDAPFPFRNGAENVAENNVMGVGVLPMWKKTVISCDQPCPRGTPRGRIWCPASRVVLAPCAVALVPEVRTASMHSLFLLKTPGFHAEGTNVLVTFGIPDQDAEL